MTNLMDSLNSIVNPEVVDALGRALGTDPSAITRGVSATGPLLMNSMAKMASTTSGAESLLKTLPQDSGGMFGGFGSLGSLISNFMSGGSAGGGLVSSLLGSGANAIGASLSKALGFNVAPLLGVVAPAFAGVVGKAIKTDNLDAAGLASMLSRQTTEFADNPANRETMALVKQATTAGNEAERLIAAYGSDWSKIAAAPSAALLMVASSDLSGPFGAIKEVKSAEAALLDAVRAAPASPLLSAAFGAGLTETALTSVKGLAKDKDALARLITEAGAAVARKSPADAEPFRAAVRNVAKATAEASKEGGFLGIGGTVVSEDEQTALSRIETALH